MRISGRSIWLLTLILSFFLACGSDSLHPLPSLHLLHSLREAVRAGVRGSMGSQPAALANGLSTPLGTPEQPMRATGSLFAGEEKFLADIRQLTFEGRNGEGYFSPDGEKIIFQAVRSREEGGRTHASAGSPYYQIFSMNRDGTGLKLMSTGKGKCTCSYFSPDGKRFIYASTHLDPSTWEKPPEKAEENGARRGETGTSKRKYKWDFDPSYEIFQADLTDPQQTLVRLTSAPGYDAEGSYSHDGKKIVFTSNRDGDLEIYTMDADGKNQKRVTYRKGYDGGPFFSPDDQEIVFRGFDAEGKVAQIYLVKTDGSNLRQVTSSPAVNWCPYFHPGGKWIVFSSNASPPPSAALPSAVPPSAAPPLAALPGAGSSRSSRFPRSTAAQKESAGGNYDLFLMRTNGTGLRQITFDPAFDALPVFSPDGKYLLWTSTRGSGTPHLFLARFLGLPGAEGGEGGAGEIREAEQPEPAGNRTGDESLQPDQHAASQWGFSTREIDRTIRFLASPDLEGRLAGTRGERLAALYVAERLRKYGLSPLGGSYLHPFSFTASLVLGEPNSLSVVRKTRPDEADRSGSGALQGPPPAAQGLPDSLDEHEIANLKLREQFIPLSFSASGEVTAPVVFAGYGISAPSLQYDDYGSVDLHGKIALILGGSPEGETPHSKFGKYLPLRIKALQAREHGANGVLVVNPGKGDDTLPPFAHQFSVGDSGILAAAMKREVAALILSSGGKKLQEIEEDLQRAPSSFPVPGVRVRMQVTLNKKKGISQNVLGFLPGQDPRLREEVLVIGAHLDHLGRGGAHSLASTSGEIHPGADDNASGVAGLLELARVLAASPSGGTGSSGKTGGLKRSLLFMAFGGEEIGTLGSAYFVKHPPFPLRRIVAMINLDMIGRMKDRALAVSGTGTSPSWPQDLEELNGGSLSLSMKSDGYGPSDNSQFYMSGIPSVHFFTGAHEDYHKPSDTVEKINLAGEEKVLRLVAALAERVAGRLERLAFTKTKGEPPASTRGFTVYLGTIPDYTAEVEGVRFSGVREGSPAERGGIRGGDILVKLGEMTIKNLYDYTYALQEHAPGDNVEVTVLRDGQPLILKVTFQRRPGQ